MKAAIYARVSTRDKGQDTANQLLKLHELVKTRGWEEIRVYEDQDSGGKSEREQFQAMLNDARLGRFKVLVFWSLDRLSREGTYETLNHLRTLAGYGVSFLSLTEQYLDTCGPFKEAVIGILAAVAAFERQRLRDRVKAGLDRARAQGRTLGRKPKVFTGEQRDALVKTYRSGIPIPQLCEMFQCRRTRLYLELRALGLVSKST